MLKTSIATLTLTTALATPTVACDIDDLVEVSIRANLKQANVGYTVDCATMTRGQWLCVDTMSGDTSVTLTTLDVVESLVWNTENLNNQWLRSIEYTYSEACH